MIAAAMNESPTGKHGIATLAGFALGGLSDEKVNLDTDEAMPKRSTASSSSSSSSFKNSKIGSRRDMMAQTKERYRDNYQNRDDHRGCNDLDDDRFDQSRRNVAAGFLRQFQQEEQQRKTGAGGRPTGRASPRLAMQPSKQADASLALPSSPSSPSTSTSSTSSSSGTSSSSSSSNTPSDNAATASEQTATMQRQMKFLMDDPLLWAQFKQRLAESHQVTGNKTSVQKVLQEFLNENEQIAQQDDMQLKLQALEQSKKQQKRRGPRMSILQSVQQFTSELAGERDETMSAAAAAAVSASTSHKQQQQQQQQGRSSSMGMGYAQQQQQQQLAKASAAIRRSASMGMGGVTNLVTTATSKLGDETVELSLPQRKRNSGNNAVAGEGGRNSPSVDSAPPSPSTLRQLRQAAVSSLAASSLAAALQSTAAPVLTRLDSLMEEREDVHHHDDDDDGDDGDDSDSDFGSIGADWTELEQALDVRASLQSSVGNRRGSMEAVPEEDDEDTEDDQ